MADYHQVTITMPNGRHIFQVTRFKAGGKMYAISFATNSVKIALMFPISFLKYTESLTDTGCLDPSELICKRR